MTDFVKPNGINFSTSKEISASELSRALRETVSFIQHLEPYAKLEKYDDWWQHDGLHFQWGGIDFDELFKIISSPKSLLESMTGDFDVYIGVAPKDNSWYLRFYLDWDATDENLVGRFDITFSEKLAERFEREVLNQFDLEIVRQNAETYYQSIIL